MLILSFMVVFLTFRFAFPRSITSKNFTPASSSSTEVQNSENDVSQNQLDAALEYIETLEQLGVE
ncbi:MAG: hypothetical protein HYZ08_00780 [Candidatus Kerfeldbacteria bacterium]|nr:hypothetical protein [Candidatus Kerfeldbacteria bacterium]